MDSSTFFSAKTLYDQTTSQLASIYNVEESRQLAKMLLEELLNVPFEKVLIDANVELKPELMADLEVKMEQLLQFTPIQYVLGKAHFFGREFLVNPSVLIPRQETEELVQEILIDNKRPNLKVLDIGSGSGCIGVTLALELDNAIVSAIDIDEGALQVTAQNAHDKGVKIHGILADILELEELSDRYDIIVSNPPYVTEMEQQQMHANVMDFEPHKALFVADNDPLLFYKKIISLAKNHLSENGKLYFEINEQFGQETLDLCKSGEFSSAKLIKDMNGKDRIVKAVLA